MATEYNYINPDVFAFRLRAARAVDRKRTLRMLRI